MEQSNCSTPHDMSNILLLHDSKYCIEFGVSILHTPLTSSFVGWGALTAVVGEASMLGQDGDFACLCTSRLDGAKGEFG